jgi:glycosyltransferase involved in cell wall biosynthesis
VEIIRLLIPAAFGTGIRNLPALLRWQWGLLRWLLRKRDEFDIIHACDFDTVIPALMIKLLARVPVIYDIFDFYADHLRSTPGWIKRIISFVDKKCIDWVDGVILVDDSRVDQIAGAAPKHCVVVYNTPKDLYSDEVIPRHPVQSGRLRLAYVGLLQVERGIFELLDVLGMHPEWSLDLAGFGGDEEAILERVNAMENVRWHGRIPYQRALEISAGADVLIATYDPIIPNHRYASPNKVFEAMMLGKPVVAAAGTNFDQIITRHECGLVVEYGDVEQLEIALTTLADDPQLRSRLGENARKAYESTYNWTEMESRLLALYGTLQT